MGLFGGDAPRVIKSAGVPDEDGEICGGSVDEQPGRPTMHGRPSQWELRTAQGNLMRMNDKPKLLPWSRESRKPEGSPRGRRP